jgi:hypothetical protein
MTVVKALLKSSLIASVVFAAAWLRQPPVEMLRIFIGYGILIAVFSLVLVFRSLGLLSDERSVGGGPISRSQSRQGRYWVRSSHRIQAALFPAQEAANKKRV